MTALVQTQEALAEANEEDECANIVGAPSVLAPICAKTLSFQIVSIKHLLCSSFLCNHWIYKGMVMGF